MEAFLSATKNISTPTVLIIADDVAGTGKQLGDVVSGVLERCSSLTGPWRDNLHVIVAAGVSASALDWSVEDVHSESLVGIELGSRLRAFDKDADLFESETDLAVAADMVDAIGRSLSPTAPRGFGDIGLLLATEQNCPNNTLPVFWKPGRHLGGDWMPLLERRL